MNPLLLLFLALLTVGIATDIRARRVPNVLVLTLVVVALIGAAGHWSTAATVANALLGLAVGLGLWLPFWLLGLLGAGDVKFFAAGSAWVGAPLAWRAALVAGMLGGVMGLVTLLARRGVRRTASDVLLQYQHAAQIIASADVAQADAAARTLPYAVPMALALGFAAVAPARLLAW